MLRWGVSVEGGIEGGKEVGRGGWRGTLVGRNEPMTSEVFCVSWGPPGGGGGTTRGPAIVIAFTQVWMSQGVYRGFKPRIVENGEVLSLRKLRLRLNAEENCRSSSLYARFETRLEALRLDCNGSTTQRTSRELISKLN